ALVIVDADAVRIVRRARVRHAKVITVVVPDARQAKRPFRAGWSGRASDDLDRRIDRFDGFVGLTQQFDVSARVDLALRPFAVEVHLVPDLNGVGLKLGYTAHKIGVQGVVFLAEFAQFVLIAL